MLIDVCVFAVNVCQAGNPVPPREGGPVLYQGQVYRQTDLLVPDGPCNCYNEEQPPVAVFRIESATVKRVIDVSACGIAAETVFEVRKIDVDATGECSVALVHLTSACGTHSYGGVVPTRDAICRPGDNLPYHSNSAIPHRAVHQRLTRPKMNQDVESMFEACVLFACCFMVSCRHVQASSRDRHVP
jgi:hypothetical protein